MTAAAPIIRALTDVPGCSLSTRGAERLAGVVRDEGARMFVEISEPGCAQASGDVSAAAEVLVVLAGCAQVTVDGGRRTLWAGDVLVLDRGAVRRVVNGSAVERLYTVVVPAEDRASADRLRSGAVDSVSVGW